MAGHLKQQQENSTIDHQRFQFLELLLIWEGSIAASAIKQKFEISLALAAQVIKKYKALYPTNLQYQASHECFLAAAEFVAQHCLGSLDEYIALTSQHSLLSHSDMSTQSSDQIVMLSAPMRKIEPKLIRPILKAIREKLRLNIHYASVSNPDYSSREIQPHSLVFDGLRWHVRAYCEKNQAFRDFVLSRFKGDSSEILGDASFGQAQDSQWNDVLPLEIMPDSRLDDNRKRIIAMDYDMKTVNGEYRKVIKVRAALLMYLMQRLHLDRYHEKAEVQQIIVSPQCQQKLKAHL